MRGISRLLEISCPDTMYTHEIYKCVRISNKNAQMEKRGLQMFDKNHLHTSYKTCSHLTAMLFVKWVLLVIKRHTQKTKMHI